jgi:hypothetical protein
MQLEFDANGVTYSPSPKFLNKFNDKKQVKSTEEEPKLNSNILTANATYYIFKDYANLGWGIASGDLNAFFLQRPVRLIPSIQLSGHGC